MKFSTCTIASFGETIRKYATALTRAGTLSLVITSCGGMFRVIVRRSTRTIRSTIGISRKRPGPFGSGYSRPRRKTIARSYSRTTLIALIAKIRTRKTTMTSATMAPVIAATLLRRHGESKPLDAVDADALTRVQRRLRPRTPELAADEHEPALAHDALHADDLLRPDRDRSSAHGDGLRHRERPEAAEQRRHQHDQPVVRVVRRARVVEQRGEPEGKRHQPRQRERAVRHHMRADDESRGAEQHEDQAAPRERQHREAEQRGDHADRAERTGDDDARVEQLEAEPDDACEEEQRHDVRVDQRRQEAR